jgi:hypothetical protein
MQRRTLAPRLLALAAALAIYLSDDGARSTPGR